jgi:hypothetical protein
MATDRCNGLHPDYYIKHIVLNAIHLQNFQQIYVHCVKVQFLCQKSVIQQVNTAISLWCSANIYISIDSGCDRVIKGAGHKAKRSTAV